MLEAARSKVTLEELRLSIELISGLPNDGQPGTDTVGFRALARIINNLDDALENERQSTHAQEDKIQEIRQNFIKELQNSLDNVTKDARTPMDWARIMIEHTIVNEREFQKRFIWNDSDAGPPPLLEKFFNTMTSNDTNYYTSTWRRCLNLQFVAIKQEKEKLSAARRAAIGDTASLETAPKAPVLNSPVVTPAISAIRGEAATPTTTPLSLGKILPDEDYTTDRMMGYRAGDLEFVGKTLPNLQHCDLDALRLLKTLMVDCDLPLGKTDSQYKKYIATAKNELQRNPDLCAKILANESNISTAENLWSWLRQTLSATATWPATLQEKLAEIKAAEQQQVAEAARLAEQKRVAEAASRPQTPIDNASRLEAEQTTRSTSEDRELLSRTETPDAISSPASNPVSVNSSRAASTENSGLPLPASGTGNNSNNQAFATQEDNTAENRTGTPAREIAKQIAKQAVTPDNYTPPKTHSNGAKTLGYVSGVLGLAALTVVAGAAVVVAAHVAIPALVVAATAILAAKAAIITFGLACSALSYWTLAGRTGPKQATTFADKAAEKASLLSTSATINTNSEVRNTVLGG